MDLKDPKTQKYLLTVLGIILLVYFWHSKMYDPSSKQLAAKQSEHEKLLTNLKTVELKAKSLAGLRQEYDILRERYQTIEELLPEEQQVPEFLLQLHSASTMSQSVVTELAPLPERGESFYNTAGYGIKFTGTYHELGRFLAAAANFPFITNISDLNITGLSPSEIEQQGVGKGKGVVNVDKRTLNAEFYLATYYVKPGEKLKGIQF